jgi:uncharacterized protein YecT (DUF1311 family)
MIRIFSLVALLLFAASPPLHAQPSRCMDEARTQLAMNECAGEEWGQADSVLNAVYAQVVAEVDSIQLPLLRDAQRAWIRLRDADCQVEAAEFEGGSMQPMVETLCLAQETRRRTEYLRRLVTAEGDATEGARSLVLQATHALFEAMEARDTAALRTLIHPRAQVVSVSERGVGVRTTDEWIPSVTRNPEPLRERMWDARVEVDGNLATLWAPYDFHLGERFSHCGFDAFTFVREGGAWKLITVAFTGRTAGCRTAP